MKIKETNKKVSIPISDNRQRSATVGNDWESEIKGKGLNEAQAAYIASLPRDESKNNQTKELLAELYEENADTASNGRLPYREIMRRNEAARKGKVMHHLTFLKKLRKLGIQCWYNSTPWEGIIGLRAIRPGFERQGLQFICGVKLGLTTEYDIFHYDRYGVELNKKFIGWRSVIIQLIAKGIITESQAHSIFGIPGVNEASAIYRRELHNIRNNRGKSK